MEEIWSQLVDNTVFLAPGLVEEFCEHYGDAIVMPPTFRGHHIDYNVKNNSGYPVYEDGKWYSVWGMRPSRGIVAIAVGLNRGGLEDKTPRPVACASGRTLTKTWTVHHVYECGLPNELAAEKATKFTNLSNLVLMDRGFHTKHSSFMHGDGKGSKWLKWALVELYPNASKLLNGVASRPVDSPPIDMVNISKGSADALEMLKELRENEPAGNAKSTKRLLAAMAR